MLKRRRENRILRCSVQEVAPPSAVLQTAKKDTEQGNLNMNTFKIKLQIWYL